MLLMAKSLKELNFRQLMDVYQEGNQDNARELYPDMPMERGILEAEQDFYEYLRTGFFAAAGAYYALWRADNRYVSALRMERYRDGLLIEAVETLPEQRRKGYAKALLKAVMAQVGQGRVYAHIAKWNTASRQLHEGCGFRKISDMAVYIDGSVNDKCETYLLELQ